MKDLLNKMFTRGITALGLLAALVLAAPSAYVHAADSKSTDSKTLSVSQQEISTAEGLERQERYNG